MNHVTIKIIEAFQGQDILEVRVNGEYIGGGQCGGEPEDNCRTRDWAWVELLLNALTQKLGGELSYEERGKES